jgi:hypothetical protein
MAISSDIKYSFNQIQIGLIAFITNLESKLQKIITDLPVFVMETGDNSYYMNKKFVQIDNKDIYLKTPRFTISFLDIQFLPDQNSNQYNVINYIFEEKRYSCTGRRVAINMPIETTFVSPNFLFMLENFEVMTALTSRPNVFTYEFMGNTYESAYVLSSNNNEKPAIEFSNTSRNCNTKFQFDLNLQLFIPRIETIEEAFEYTTTRFNLIQKDTEGTVELDENLDFTEE